MNLDKKHESGMWFLTAAIHYNLLHFCDGNLNQFKNMVRNTRWAKKDILAKKFKKLLVQRSKFHLGITVFLSSSPNDLH
jgi:hypothetical protein